MSAIQVERLHFWELKETSRPVVRRRVLKRLNDAHALIALPRRIGGNQHGSEQAMFALDIAGAQLLEQRHDWKNAKTGTLTVPGALFHKHRLAVSELYVRLKETVRSSSEFLWVTTFETEPECWWPYKHNEGSRGNRKSEEFVKPDAHLVADLRGSTGYGHFWIEVDLGTESVDRVRRKIELYARINRDDYASKPLRHMPKIFVTTTTTRRRDAIRDAIEATKWGVEPEWKGGAVIYLHQTVAVRVECFDDAVAAIIEELPQPLAD